MKKCKFCKRYIEEDSIFCRHCGGTVVQRRKKKGEVSIPKITQKPNGKYHCQLRLGGVSISITKDTEQEVRALAIAYKTGAMPLPTKEKVKKLTLSDAIDKHIENFPVDVSPQTVRNYYTIQHSRFKSAMKLNIFDDINWQKVINDECKLGVSPNTVIGAWRSVRCVLRENGVEPKVTLPRSVPSSREWLEFDQIFTFLNAIHGHRDELYALLALHGLRRSEIFALTPDKIDLEKKIIHVQGAVVQAPNGKLVYKSSNKTVGSERSVHIVIKRLVDLLTEHDGNFLPPNADKISTRINKLCAENGLPQVGLHGLRHSFASLAYHLGVKDASTMVLGGWVSPDVLHDFYTHLASKDLDDDIAKIEKFFITG